MIKIDPVEDREATKLASEIWENYKQLSGLWCKVLFYILPFKTTELSEELHEVTELLQSGIFDRRKNKAENLEKAFWRLIDLHNAVCGVKTKSKMNSKADRQKERQI